jgi:accessory gene regulator protein AgrB
MQQHFELYIKNEFKFSDYEVELIQYVAKAFLSELSKVLILSIYFNYINMMPEFLCSIIIIAFLRLNIGGYHCNHYWSCLFVSFAIVILSVNVLPFYAPPIAPRIITLVFSIIFISKYGPAQSLKRPRSTDKHNRKCTNRAILVISAYIITSIFFQNNPYFIIVYWTIFIIIFQYILVTLYRKKKN